MPPSPPATRDEVISDLYIREIKSCIRGDHPLHVSKSCLRACVRACIHACTHAVPQRTFAAQRNGVSFLLRKSCPNGERMAHGWNRLTCKLRARMLDTSGSSLIVMRVNAQSIRRHRCASDPFAFVAFANIVSNSCSKNEMLFAG